MREGRSEAASSSPAFVPRSDDEPAASHEIGIDIIAWECDYALRLLLARRAGAGPRRADCRRRRRRRHQQDHVGERLQFLQVGSVRPHTSRAGERRGTAGEGNGRRRLDSAAQGVGTALRRNATHQGLRAATSLKKTFTDFSEQFTAENPGASVEFLFAGSSDLVTQPTQGADADVFASADTKTWTRQRRPVCWRQPGELRVVQRPDAARSQRRRVRATSAVRVGYPESRAGHGREDEPGERGVLGFRRPEQGDNRLGRRRSGLRHRRDRGGRQGCLRGFPRSFPRGQHVSDCCAEGLPRIRSWRASSSTW